MGEVLHLLYMYHPKDKRRGCGSPILHILPVLFCIFLCSVLPILSILPGARQEMLICIVHSITWSSAGGVDLQVGGDQAARHAPVVLVVDASRHVR